MVALHAENTGPGVRRATSGLGPCSTVIWTGQLLSLDPGLLWCSDFLGQSVFITGAYCYRQPGKGRYGKKCGLL